MTIWIRNASLSTPSVERGSFPGAARGPTRRATIREGECEMGPGSPSRRVATFAPAFVGATCRSSVGPEAAKSWRSRSALRPVLAEHNRDGIVAYLEAPDRSRPLHAHPDGRASGARP